MFHYETHHSFDDQFPFRREYLRTDHVNEFVRRVVVDLKVRGGVAVTPSGCGLSGGVGGAVKVERGTVWL
ncbi:hypothetical protein RIF29_39371 [Crotalaria pallida]|uniref:Uncharacterized protein n=1 Tax=Crotalaria pallida TaxID=3830 RepID=A0AAN9HQM6_CROPI